MSRASKESRDRYLSMTGQQYQDYLSKLVDEIDLEKETGNVIDATDRFKVQSATDFLDPFAIPKPAPAARFAPMSAADRRTIRPCFAACFTARTPP